MSLKKRGIKHITKRHHDYYTKSKSILADIKKEPSFKMMEIPDYILKYHLSNIKPKRDYVYDNVYIISSKVAEDNELECVSLNNAYERCKGKVRYIHENVNNNGEDYAHKKNLPLCTRHLNEMMRSDTRTKLKFGYYYESELYTRQEYKPL